MANNWYAAKSAGDSQGLVIEEDTGRSVAVAYDVKDTPLLAAAPELLAALIDMVALAEHKVLGRADNWDGSTQGQLTAAIRGARAAIAKVQP